MVTGKRDFLSNDAKDLIREAGIFHIITISGVQITLVAGIFFVVTRRLLALSPTLALKYPIKKWAAVVAMAGSLLYDVATGSRVGTERALIMTLIVLGAVIMDRRALTMRNLAFAVLAVVAIEPEAILGVSFQLSFAAVAALVVEDHSDLRAPLVGQPHALKVEGAHAKAESVREHHGQWRISRPDLAYRQRHAIGRCHYVTPVAVERLEILVGIRVFDFRLPRHRAGHRDSGDGAHRAQARGTCQPSRQPDPVHVGAVMIFTAQRFPASR